MASAMATGKTLNETFIAFLLESGLNEFGSHCEHERDFDCMNQVQMIAD
jgi:hypothetical protein